MFSDKMNIKKSFGEFVRFTGVGALATLCHYCVFGIGLAAFQGDPVFWSVLGSMIGAVLGYVLNYFFTFKASISILSGGLRYLLMVVMGIGLNAFLMFLLTHIIIINPWIAQVISTGIVFFFNFAMSKLWVFKAA